ncbi:MAG: hypothetical protein F4Z18_08300 [Caldilineaceae bacterium SB0666_bin_21]|nr:hypothetical protein [Caldilineaceae bacterium SB0666_bin_21]
MLEFRFLGPIASGVVILIMLWLPPGPDNIISAWPAWVRPVTSAVVVMGLVAYALRYFNLRS